MLNLPLRDDARVDPRSSPSVAWLARDVRTFGVGILTAQCTQPLYCAAPDAPRVRVELVAPYRDPALRAAWRSVPMPPGVAPARCSDGNVSIAQVQPDGAIKTWEFWQFARVGGRLTARGGGVIDDVRGDRGVASEFAWRNPRPTSWLDRRSTRFWNVSASSLSMNAGVITQEEMLAGRVDHALAVALPSTAAGKWRWPAQRGDGYDVDPDALPEGARLRLDPAVDVDALPGPPLVRTLARAAQRYGIIVRDQTAAQTVFMTDARPGRPVSATPALAGMPAYAALQRFPWDRLELLAAPTCTQHAVECRVRTRAVVDAARDADGTWRLDTTNSSLNYPRVRTVWRVRTGRTSTVRRCRTCLRLAVEPRGRRRTVVRVTIRTAGGEVARRRVALGG